MKAMMFIKVVVVTVALFGLVLMGLHNQAPVDFNLPPLMKDVVHQPAALMYLGFFALGLIIGTILNIGSSPQKQSGKSPKPA